MQMDPTTLQLIQVLERTVSSGECRSRARRRAAGDVTKTGSLSLVRPVLPSRSGDARLVAAPTAAAAAAAAMAISGPEYAGAMSGGTACAFARSRPRRAPARSDRTAVPGGRSRDSTAASPVPVRRDREPFRTLLRAISRPVVLLLGALSVAGKVLSRVTVARIRTHSRDTRRGAPRARLTYGFSAIPDAHGDINN